MYGRYPKHRGQQIASGRFGVSSLLINSSRVGRDQDRPGRQARRGRPPAGLEGHPGDRPGPQRPGGQRPHQPVQQPRPLLDRGPGPAHRRAQDVEPARARSSSRSRWCRASARSRSASPRPGADVITMSGYDGGTGAARQHALRRAGLPCEIGTVLAHHALTEAGIRDRVEIWADGGLRSAADCVKLICMGANRLGFGTASMVAIGCTICRGCQLDTCHVGIATQIDEARGRPSAASSGSCPAIYEPAVEALVRYFTEMGEALRDLRRRRWASSEVQDLVGQADRLVQVSHHDRLDLTEPADPGPGPARHHRRRRATRASSGRSTRRRPTARPRWPPSGWPPASRSRWRRRPPRRPTATWAPTWPGCIARAATGSTTTRSATARAPRRRRRPGANGAGDAAGNGLQRARQRPHDHAGRPRLHQGRGRGQRPGRVHARGRARARLRRRAGRRGQVRPRRRDPGAEGPQRPRRRGSAGTWARASPTAPSAACSSSRATPTPARASGCRAPTWCWAASRAEPLNDRLGTLGGAGQLQGLRLRVHDRRPRRRARRPGALALQRHDRRRRLRAPERRLGPRRGGDAAAPVQGRQGQPGGARRVGRGQRGASCCGDYRTALAGVRPGRGGRAPCSRSSTPRRSTSWPIIPVTQQADPNISTE